MDTHTGPMAIITTTDTGTLDGPHPIDPFEGGSVVEGRQAEKG